MSRKQKGTVDRGKWRRVNVRVNGRLLWTKFLRAMPPAQLTAQIKAWREKQRKDAPRARGPLTGLAADVATLLAKPEIAAQPYVKQLARHLAMWVELLGADRPRHDVTRDEVEAVIQRWLRTLKPGTVYHRRGALKTLYRVLDADNPDAPNPVRGTTCPPCWTPKKQAIPLATRLAILAAMPDYNDASGIRRRLSFAKLAVAILLATGIRPVDLLRVKRTMVHFETASVDIPGSKKGRGSPAWTCYPNAEGLAAFRAWDAANAYGGVTARIVSRCFKRAARRVCGDDTPIHLYGLRHSVAKDTYARERDLGSVGRRLGHVPGSKATAQYASDANEEVDRAVAAADTAWGAVPVEKFPEKVSAFSKSRKRKTLQRAS
jgi:integrase